MPHITACELPANSLLCRYQNTGAYTDCYVSEISRHLSFEDYVEAFYSSWLFKVERLLLAWMAGKPSTDSQARQLV